MVWKQKVPLASCKHIAVQVRPKLPQETNVESATGEACLPLFPSHESYGTIQILEFVVFWRSAPPLQCNKMHCLFKTRNTRQTSR